MAMKKQMDRRALLRMAMYGGVGSAWALEQLGGVPGFGTLAEHLIRYGNPLTRNRFDAYAMMGEALAGGPSLLAVHQAMAEDANDWTLVQIKVCNHVFAPLVFRLGELSGETVTTGNGVPLPSNRAGQAKDALIQQGLDQISDKARYKALRFNKWFANILHNGTNDGAAASASNLSGLKATDVAEMSADKVAIQAFLGLAQNDATVNHALRGCKLRAGMSDLTLFCQENQLIASPLGISCFMMGDNYDRAEGATPRNVVLGTGTAEVEVVGSRTVADYVTQLKQYAGKSYADRAPIEQNVIYRLDKLVVADPVLRRELVNSIAKFSAGSGPLAEAAVLEAERQTLNRQIGNTQSASNSSVPGAATGEFLAQCKYVAASMDLPGVPVRNYSLFLNMTDLDGKDLDDARNNLSDGQTGQVRAYGYIEGMRQLAMGLNVLGKKIAAGTKMIVVVTSEGGRSADMADSKTNFALVMGPGAHLKDKLYANIAAINAQTGVSVANPAAVAAAMKWDVDGLMDASGSKDTASVPRNGDVQMGVVEFLEEVRGKQVRKALSSDDGRFVKLARK